MRTAVALAVLSILVSGCTPDIPVRTDFGSSALVPSGDTPPEFGQFNAYDPAVGPLVANQICATPYTAAVEKTISAVPGAIVHTQGRCRLHTPFFGDGDFLPQ